MIPGKTENLAEEVLNNAHPVQEEFTGWLPFLVGTFLLFIAGMVAYAHNIEVTVFHSSIIFLVLVVVTIMLLRKREVQLLESRHKLQQIRGEVFNLHQLMKVEKEKSELLLDSLTHELISPLNYLVGVSEILIDDLANKDYVNLAENLDKQRYHLKNSLRIITSVRSITLTETGGNVAKDRISFPLGKLLDSLEINCLKAIQRNENVLDMNREEELYVGEVHSNYHLLESCLMIILQNSSRFTQQGVISVNVQKVTLDHRDHIIFTIKDTGFGYDTRQVERFFSLIPVMLRDKEKNAGSGLGFQVCRKMAEVLGGFLKVHALPDIGCTYTMGIPAQ
jgi:K+-sensing histidine kinase KdpD